MQVDAFVVVLDAFSLIDSHTKYASDIWTDRCCCCIAFRMPIVIRFVNVLAVDLHSSLNFLAPLVKNGPMTISILQLPSEHFVCFAPTTVNPSTLLC